MTPPTDTDTDERALLRDTADRIATAAGDDTHAAWRALHTAGLTALREPGDDGPAATVTMTALVVERLARTVCAAPLLGHLLATELLRLAGACASPSAADQPLTVVLDDTWTALATGQGTAWDAALASHGVTLDGSTVLRHELGGAVDTVDPTRPLRRTTGAREPVGELTTESLHAFESFARTLLAADMVGAATGIFDSAVAHVQERHQFGVPVGSFQAVQHLCAEAYVGLEGLRSAVAFAEHTLDTGQAAAVAASLVAKAYAEEAAIGAVETAVQVFGGIAITTEHRAHRHLRRVLTDRDVFGDAALLNDRLLDLGEHT